MMMNDYSIVGAAVSRCPNSLSALIPVAEEMPQLAGILRSGVRLTDPCRARRHPRADLRRREETIGDDRRLDVADIHLNDVVQH
jgi:hypothetical protein